MRHIRRHKLTRKLGTVESSIKANDNVTVVTFLNPILQSTFQAQHQLNDVRVLHERRWMENVYAPNSGKRGENEHFQPRYHVYIPAEGAGADKYLSNFTQV